MTIEQKRRELFEAWWSSTPILSDNKRTIAEKSWQAALDAVVITLPEACDVEEWSESFITFHGEGYSKELIIEAIESNGLGLKVLP